MIHSKVNTSSVEFPTHFCRFAVLAAKVNKEKEGRGSMPSRMLVFTVSDTVIAVFTVTDLVFLTVTTVK